MTLILMGDRCSEEITDTTTFEISGNPGNQAAQGNGRLQNLDLFSHTGKQWWLDPGSPALGRVEDFQFEIESFVGHQHSAELLP